MVRHISLAGAVLALAVVLIYIVKDQHRISSRRELAAVVARSASELAKRSPHSAAANPSQWADWINQALYSHAVHQCNDESEAIMRIIVVVREDSKAILVETCHYESNRIYIDGQGKMSYVDANTARRIVQAGEIVRQAMFKDAR